MMSEIRVRDQGAYILILWLKEARHISIGRLGSLRFKRGYYIYIGSAKKRLSKRIGRHKRKKKKPFWHIDYLRAHATFYRAIPIRASEDLECKIASKLRDLADWIISGFGCSDCQCETHLFATKSDPLLSPSFIGVVSKLSTGRIKKEIEIM
jgi:sugar fermentation stimulation protein A